MTDEAVDSPPEMAEVEEPSMMSLIAESAGVEESFFENATEEDSDAEPSEDVELEEESDEPEETEAEEEPEAPPVKADSSGVKKRIGKLVDRAEKAEGEIEELRNQINSLKEKAPEPEALPADTGAEKFEGILDPKELDRREADAEHLREWLMTNPDGGEYEDRAGSEYEVEYDQAKKLMVETDRDLRKNLPGARKQLQVREQITSEAFKQFDWMNDTNSTEFAQMATFLRTNPRAKKFFDSDPQAVMLFGFATEGIKSFAKNQPKESVPATAPKVPGSPTRATPTSRKSAKNSQKALLEKVAESGDASDAASYIEQMLFS